MSPLCFLSFLLSLSVCAWPPTQCVSVATPHLIAQCQNPTRIRIKVRPRAKGESLSCPFVQGGEPVVSICSARDIQHAWVCLSLCISWTSLAQEHLRAKFERQELFSGNRQHVPYCTLTRSCLCAGALEGKGQSLRVSIRAARNIPQELIGLSLYVTLEAKAPDPPGDLKSSIAEKYPFGESCAFD